MVQRRGGSLNKEVEWRQCMVQRRGGESYSRDRVAGDRIVGSQVTGYNRVTSDRMIGSQVTMVPDPISTFLRFVLQPPPKRTFRKKKLGIVKKLQKPKTQPWTRQFMQLGFPQLERHLHTESWVNVFIHLSILNTNSSTWNMLCPAQVLGTYTDTYCTQFTIVYIQQWQTFTCYNYYTQFTSLHIIAQMLVGGLDVWNIFYFP